MELDEFKRLSGIGQGVYTNTPMTPLSGSNISITGTEKRKLERERNIQPGTPEWFQLWFSKPYLTGEPPIK